MSCIKWTGRPTKTKRLEQTAMKDGFRPGVHEKHGFYIGQWVNDMKQGQYCLICLNKFVTIYIYRTIYTYCGDT